MSSPLGSADFMKQERVKQHEADRASACRDSIAIPRAQLIASSQVSLCSTEGQLLQRIYLPCRAPESCAITSVQTWAVFHSDNFAERGFTTEQHADCWLQQTPTWPLAMVYSNVTNEDQGWRGPIPIVARLGPPSERFTGPYLKNAQPPAHSSGDDLIRAELRDLVGEDDFNTVLEAANGLGSKFPLSRDVQRRVLKRASAFAIPKIECRLRDDWGFKGVLGDVRSRPYHSGTITASGLVEHLYCAAVELETSLLRVLTNVCATDVYNFLTSLQFHEHMKRLAERISGLYPAGTNIEVAFSNITRWIGSYAVQYRPALLPGMSDPQVSTVQNPIIQETVPPPEPNAIVPENILALEPNASATPESLLTAHIATPASPHLGRRIDLSGLEVASTATDPNGPHNGPSETPDFSSSIPRLMPGRRGPDLESSRERLNLVSILVRELATIKQDLKHYCTAESLKKKHPEFILWDHLGNAELKELIDGEEFKPKAFAETLTLRKFGLMSRETLKKDRRKLRNALKLNPT